MKQKGMKLSSEGWSDQIFPSKKIFVIIFPDSSHYNKCNGSCFKYVNERLSKLHMFKVTNFMTCSVGLLIYVILLINHTHLFLFSPGHNH